MIFDTLNHFKNYVSCHSQFKDVVSFIENTNLIDLENGKHLINDNGAFASVNEYEAKAESDCFIECHKKYIDIQIVAKGSELIGFAPIENCISQPYDEEKDLQKLHGELSYLPLKQGMFIVFFPHDAHIPCIRLVEKQKNIKKIVFKIPVE